MLTIKQLLNHVENHRCYTHPLFYNWGKVNPDVGTLGALFQQIQLFCSSTRAGGNYLEAMKVHNLAKENHLQQAIVESEANHGPELATMAGYVINKKAKQTIFADVYDQEAVENKLKSYSNQLLGNLPGYNKDTSLTLQAQKSIDILNRRQETDYETTIKNIGTTLALEKISNRQLIPGEKHCLVDCNLYDLNINDPEMHYLLEHFGEIGAEQEHEKYAIEMVESVLNEKKAPLILEGVDDFLNALACLWDLLDSALLQSGYQQVA
jgi:hypothetical protein